MSTYKPCLRIYSQHSAFFIDCFEKPSHKQVGVILCPFFHILHFIFPCSAVILTWQRQQWANSQMNICAWRCLKKKKIWISCHWFVVPLFLSGVCIPGWLLSCSDYSHGLQSIHWGSLFKMVLVSLLHYWNERLLPEAGVKQRAIATLKKGRVMCAWMQM